MRRRIILALLVLGFILAFYGTRPHGQTPNLSWIAVVSQAENHDFSGMEFFQLKRKDEAPLLTVQDSTELAAFLRAANGKKVVVTIEVVQKLER